MLIKAYLKRHMFHLPMKEEELLRQVEEALNKKDINKSMIHKIHAITKIEDNENILIERQNTNIFLLNLLLLVLNHKGKEITEKEYYNEKLIIEKLEEETQLPLKGLPFEGVEDEVNKYLNPPSNETKVEPISEEKTTETKESTGNHSFLENVQFSVDWLKRAQQELNEKN